MTIKINYTSKAVALYFIIKLVIMLHLTFFILSTNVYWVPTICQSLFKILLFQLWTGQKILLYLWIFILSEEQAENWQSKKIMEGIFNGAARVIANFYWVLIMWQTFSYIIYMHNSIWFSQPHCQVGNVIIYIIQVRKLRHIYVK